MPERKKQISLWIPLSVWLALRQEAARQKVPMTELCQRWLQPNLAAIAGERK